MFKGNLGITIRYRIYEYILGCIPRAVYSQVSRFSTFFLYACVDVRYLIHACLVSLPANSQQKISRRVWQYIALLDFTLLGFIVIYNTWALLQTHCKLWNITTFCMIFYIRRVKSDIKLRYFTIEIYTWITLRTSSILKTYNFTTLRDRKNFINFYGKFLTFSIKSFFHKYLSLHSRLEFFWSLRRSLISSVARYLLKSY